MTFSNSAVSIGCRRRPRRNFDLQPEDVAKIYVRAVNGLKSTMIPLDTVVTTEFTSGPDPVTHFNGYNTALVLGAAAPGTVPGRCSMLWIMWPRRC